MESIIVKVRGNGTTYNARFGKGKTSIEATSTSSPEWAARACAVKVLKLETDGASLLELLAVRHIPNSDPAGGFAGSQYEVIYGAAKHQVQPIKLNRYVSATSLVSWTLVATDVPDSMTTVLIACEDEEVDAAWYNGDGTWCWLTGHDVPSKVIAWADMPEAPKFEGGAS